MVKWHPLNLGGTGLQGSGPSRARGGPLGGVFVFSGAAEKAGLSEVLRGPSFLDAPWGGSNPRAPTLRPQLNFGDTQKGGVLHKGGLKRGSLLVGLSRRRCLESPQPRSWPLPAMRVCIPMALLAVTGLCCDRDTTLSWDTIMESSITTMDKLCSQDDLNGMLLLIFVTAVMGILSLKCLSKEGTRTDELNYNHGEGNLYGAREAWTWHDVDEGWAEKWTRVLSTTGQFKVAQEATTRLFRWRKRANRRPVRDEPHRQKMRHAAGASTTIARSEPYFISEKEGNDAIKKITVETGVRVCVRQCRFPSGLSLPGHGHTLADGNCVWRAAAKAVAWSNLKNLKRRVLRDACHPGQEARLRQLRQMGAWADTTAMQMMSLYLKREIQVWQQVDERDYQVILIGHTHMEDKEPLILHASEGHCSPWMQLRPYLPAQITTRSHWMAPWRTTKYQRQWGGITSDTGKYYVADDVWASTTLCEQHLKEKYVHEYAKQCAQYVMTTMHSLEYHFMGMGYRTMENPIVEEDVLDDDGYSAMPNKQGLKEQYEQKYIERCTEYVMTTMHSCMYPFTELQYETEDVGKPPLSVDEDELGADDINHDVATKPKMPSIKTNYHRKSFISMGGSV